MGALTASPMLILVILGVVAVAGAGFLGVRLAQAKKAKAASPALTGALGVHLQSLVGNPLAKQLLGHLASFAEATHHAALDAAIVKMLPMAAPFIPAVNAVADTVESRLSSGVAPASTPLPGAPETRPIISFLEAKLAELKGAPKP